MADSSLEHGPLPNVQHGYENIVAGRARPIDQRSGASNVNASLNICTLEYNFAQHSLPNTDAFGSKNTTRENL